ncbi:4-hydroxybenzoate transporter [Caballeronia mineralivorans PML1(12)]|uniref:4-hydroxybenzoate transporter n=1 Tax=Caballeronia mineralivorans PML1(12) TaxID=908627 RepID=A0A0J1FPX4_9BURK|nr:MFS transporter [Caballeronia mineralivorans]KLU21818.1 4-hydroxybenzoate transporter [Caballeronia mineralivorans PML1(12)]
MQPATLDVQAFINQHRFSGLQWRILLLCFLVVAVDGLNTASVGFIAPALAAHWNVSKAALAPVMSAALFGLAIGALTAGPMADRYGRKSVIVTSVLTFGLSSLFAAQAGSLSEMVALRFVAGLGLGAAMPNTSTLMTEYSPMSRRSLFGTLMLCGFTLGSASAGFLSSLLIPTFGWRSVLLVGGILPTVLGMVLIVLLPESARFLVVHRAPAARIAAILRKIAPLAKLDGVTFCVPEGTQNGRASIRALFAPQYAAGTLLLWMTNFFGQVVVYLLTGWLPTLMGDAGIPIQSAALVTAMFMFGGTFGAVFLGWLMDRTNRYLVLAVSYGTAVAFIVPIGSHQDGLILLKALVFGAGFAMGAQAALSVLASQFYETPCRATGVSWMLGIGRLGGIVGASTGGILLTAGWDFQLIFTSLAAPAALAATAIGAMGIYVGKLAAPVAKAEAMEGGTTR